MWVICMSRTFDGIRYADAQQQWGAAVILEFSDHEDSANLTHRQLKGPFDIWKGEWWRIPVSAFHHGGVVHLLLNCAAAWILGRRLEQRWGSLRYAIFLGPAILIPMLAEFMTGKAAVGFSGAICAMLGALMILQADDPREDDVEPEIIFMSMAFIVMGIASSYLELSPLRIANTAHVSGLVYGWIAAWCVSGSASRYRFARVAFYGAHLLLLPTVWMATHPVQDGRYLWYLADRDSRTPPQGRERLLKMALDVDPSLTAIWLRLADSRLAEKNPQAAWTVILEGLSKNPTDVDLFDAARAVWRRFPQGTERDIAEDELKRVFGDQADAWSRQIRNTRLVAKATRSPQELKSEPLDPRDFPLNKPIDLEWRPKVMDPRTPVINPDQPDSAGEGATL